MTTPMFIPAGRTSLVKRGAAAFQVQTEYAARPVPRITTTVSHDGRVLHKIERALEQAISNFEEQDKTELTLRRQHAAVLTIIENGTFDSEFLNTQTVTQKLAVTTAPAVTSLLLDKLKVLPSVQRVFAVAADGNFVGGAESSEAFRKLFSEVYKSMDDLLEIFSTVPGSSKREPGVCEIEPDRLYLLSDGAACYFVMVDKGQGQLDFEKNLRSVLD